jgi:hypothetical protein
VKEAGKDIWEKKCVGRFSHWYNKQHNRNYICERAEAHFTELKSKPRWDFVGYEPDNPEEWIGIEVKEPDIGRETSISFAFWRRLCSDLSKGLPGKGIQGEFEISLPPALILRGERHRFLEAFSQVLIDEQSGWKICETKDVGPDVWSKFPKWPAQRSNADEWDEWGRDRPSKLELTKISDSGCKVSVVTSPVIFFDVKEEHDKALNEVFKVNNDHMHSDRQLELATKKGASKTILLLAGIGVDEGLTKDFVRNLDRRLISHIDGIYLVDMGDKDSVVKMS